MQWQRVMSKTCTMENGGVDKGRDVTEAHERAQPHVLDQLNARDARFNMG